MLRDAQGHALSGATPEAATAFDRAVRAFTLIYGDTLGFYETARKAAPSFVMAHLGKAWAWSLASDPILEAEARVVLDSARSLSCNEREAAHFATLAHAVESRRAAALKILERHLMSYPFDL